MDIDPKLGWALRNPQFFPIDINTADYKQIIRIPGIGRQSAMKIIKARKFGKLREYQLKKIGISYNRAKFFMICADSPFTLGEMSMMHVKQSILQFGNSKYKNRIPENQLSLF
jgi:predicted DNA-binding helix-hairpin-helix protein